MIATLDVVVYSTRIGLVWVHYIHADLRDYELGRLSSHSSPPIYMTEDEAYTAKRVLERYFLANRDLPDLKLPWREWGRVNGIARNAFSLSPWHYRNMPSIPAVSFA